MFLYTKLLLRSWGSDTQVSRKDSNEVHSKPSPIFPSTEVEGAPTDSSSSCRAWLEASSLPLSSPLLPNPPDHCLGVFSGPCHLTDSLHGFPQGLGVSIGVEIIGCTHGTPQL